MLRSAPRTPVLLALVAVLALAAPAGAAAPAMAPSLADVARLNGLWQYEGTYEYDDDRTVDILAHEGRLYAVLDEVKHPLRQKAGDVFINAAGGEVTFYRLGPLVRGFKQGTRSYERKTRLIRNESRDLFFPSAGRPWRPDRAFRYVAPPDLQDGIGIGEASDTTLPLDAVYGIVRGVEEETWPDVHAVLVSRNGRLVMEEYFYGYDRKRPHQTRQVTAGVIAMTVGAAIEGRILPGAHVAAAPYLRYRERTRPEPRRERITLAHLLSMRSGVDCDDHGRGAAVNDLTLYGGQDWVKTFIQAPLVRDPGTDGPYCSAGVLTAGRIVERASQKRLREVADELLFGRLRFDRDQWRWPFVLARRQAHEYGQAWLTPRQMMTLGLMLKDDGRWLGRQVLGEDWVRAMTDQQSVVAGEGYGYGVWRRRYDVPTVSGPVRVDTLMLSGDGGQRIWIVEDLDLVVATTGGTFTQGAAPVDAIFAEAILPSILNTDEAARSRLGPAAASD